MKMSKRLAAAALAGIASAAVEPYASESTCTGPFTSTLIYRSTTLYSTYYATQTLGEPYNPAPTGPAPVYGGGNSSSSVAGPSETYPPATTVTDVTTIYTTTCPAESTYTSGSETLTSSYTTVSTLTSTYQSTVTIPGGYGSGAESTPTTYPAESSPASPVTESSPAQFTESATNVYSTPAASSPETTEAPEVTTPYNGASSWDSESTSEAGGIGSYIISPMLPETTTLPPVVPYPVPSGNATLPTASTGLPTASSSGYPVQQTGAAVAAKPLGAMLGLAGLAAALL